MGRQIFVTLLCIIKLIIVSNRRLGFMKEVSQSNSSLFFKAFLFSRCVHSKLVILSIHYQTIYFGNTLILDDIICEIYQGGLSEGFKTYIAENELPDDTYTEDGVALFRVQGSGPDNMQAIQVDLVCMFTDSPLHFCTNNMITSVLINQDFMG